MQMDQEGRRALLGSTLDAWRHPCGNVTHGKGCDVQHKQHCLTRRLRAGHIAPFFQIGAKNRDLRCGFCTQHHPVLGSNHVYDPLNPILFMNASFKVRLWIAHKRRADSSISAMRPPCYSLLEEMVILGVIYGSLVWRVCNPAAPCGTCGAAGHP